MPTEWRGTWFEGGVGDVTITADGVLNKGDCVDNINDYYLLDNRCDISHSPRYRIKCESMWTPVAYQNSGFAPAWSVSEWWLARTGCRDTRSA